MNWFRSGIALSTIFATSAGGRPASRPRSIARSFANIVSSAWAKIVTSCGTNPSAFVKPEARSSPYSSIIQASSLAMC